MAVILIVEDDEAMARILEYSLRKAGHSPLVARDGRSALNKVRRHPGLILLDLGLPDIGGGEVLRHLQSQPDTAQIPVVIVSGQPDAAAIVAQSGGNSVAAVLQKPVFSADLCEVVDTVLSVHAAQDSVAPGPVEQERAELIYRLISKGSDRLVFQVCRRLGADLTWHRGYHPTEALSWPEIVSRAAREGLLGEAEGQVLLKSSALRPPAMGQASGPSPFPGEPTAHLLRGVV